MLNDRGFNINAMLACKVKVKVLPFMNGFG